MPWVRRDAKDGDASSRRNSSIDGSVAKAKMVWENVSVKKSPPEELIKNGPKKGSSFKHPKPVTVATPIQKSSTTENLLNFTLDEAPPQNNSGLKLRPKDKITNGDSSDKRRGFVEADSNGSDAGDNLHKGSFNTECPHIDDVS